MDVGTLNLLSKKKSDVAVTIYTQKQTKLTKADVKNFNAQYPTLKIKYCHVKNRQRGVFLCLFFGL